MRQRYFEEFDDIEDVRRSFSIEKKDILDAEVVFASYGSGGYDGSAIVIFQRDNKLYEVSGGHCSCYGLEGQWSPEEVTWSQLAMRQFSSIYSHEALEALAKLIRWHVPRA